MEQDKKNVIKFIGLMIIYILLSALGIFGLMETVLFPIIAVPFALYCVKNKIDKSWHIIFHVIVSIAIYLMMHSILGILIYLVSVVIPVYIILFLYKQEMPLPNIMMYGGLILAGIVFVYFSVMKGIGFDFEVQFGASLDALNSDFAVTLDSIVRMGDTSGVSSVELEAGIAELKNYIGMNIEALKTFYAAIVVSQVVMSFSATVLIVNAIARRRNKTLPRTGQILEFRVSKMAVLLLVLSMLIKDLNIGSAGAIQVLTLNLMIFLISLLQIAGMLSLIALLRRTSVSQGIKVLGYIGVILLFTMLPGLLMFYGCLDAIFNYRKVSIVV